MPTPDAEAEEMHALHAAATKAQKLMIEHIVQDALDAHREEADAKVDVSNAVPRSPFLRPGYMGHVPLGRDAVGASYMRSTIEPEYK